MKGRKARRIFVGVLAVMLMMSMSVSAAFGYSASFITVTPGSTAADVDGQAVTLDVPAKIINDRTMVPIRFIAESLKFKVDWDNAARTVVIGENKEILLPVGSTAATVNGKTVTLDSPAIIEGGRTLVPLRFISESLGAIVSWDNDAREALIEYSAQLIKARELYGQPVDGEEAVIAAIDDKFAYDFATKLAAFGDAKDGRGMHLVGSTAGKAAAQHSYDTFKKIGLSPEFHTFKATGWEYYASSMKIEGHENLDYFITSAPHTPATPAEGITGELVYVGTASKEELDGLDLTGKIALAEFDWDYSLWMNNIEFQVAEHGAIGLIYFSTHPYGSDPSGQAEFPGDWSGTAARIPTWIMKQIDGFKLAALAENEELTVTAISDCKTIKDATGYNVLATIKGTKYPNEYIVINAHTDAYFHALQDASAPVGIMMGMAKAMIDSGYKPDRSIIFLSTDGEEAGGGETLYDWLVGSWAIVNDKVSEWGGKIVDAHTIEMVGDSKSTNFGFRASDVMYLFTAAMADSMNNTGTYAKEVSVDNYMTTSSDEWAFSYMGYPTTRTISENAAGEVYQSTMDSPVRFSYQTFIDNIKAQSTLIMRVDKQTFAPYDLSRDAELYLDSLDNTLLGKRGVNLTGMEDALTSYIADAQRLIDLNLDITEKYNQALADGKDVSKVNTLIADYNKDMRAAAKTIVQGTQYVALDIPVNQVEYYQFIPGAFEGAIDALKKADAEGAMEALYEMDVEALDQFSVWYSEMLEYDTWYNTYYEALFPEESGRDYKWVTGRLLKYYDIYAVMNDVNAKVEAGETDFTVEINEFTKMKTDVEKRLTNGFNKDLGMWKTAKAQLPITKAEKILEELEK